MNIQNFYKYSLFSTLAYVNWEESAKSDPETAIANANKASRVPGISGGAIDTLGEKIFLQEGWRIVQLP